MSTPLVSIIIISFNTRALTVKSIRAALASQGFKPKELEIIVVDNNSSDDTVAYLQQHLPEVKLIANKDNKGFGGGNNQGAHLAKGRYILLLNTDAFLSPDSLKVMVDALKADESLVSVGPQLCYGDGTLQPSAGYLPTPLRVIAWMLWLDKLLLVKKLIPTPYHVFDPAWHTKVQYPGWLMGACVVFRRAEFLAVGGFDEHIFMYAEEVELYRRLHDKFGKRVLFTPSTSVTHLGGSSTKKANAYRLHLELKGIEYIYAKHYPHLYYPVKAVITLGVVLRLLLFSLIPSRRDTLVEYRKYFV